MLPFDFQMRTRIVFGPGRVDSLGALAGELGARRALVVSDPGIVAAGHTERGLESLRQAGIETHLFDGVAENPTTECVEAGLVVAKRYQPELLVGFGGGSSMDCAKGINFLYTGGGKMQDYWGVGKAIRPMLPMIAVPTTAGTGSEAQSFALISDSKTHVKMACGDPKAACRMAILDPGMTVTQPPRVTALTGIDAIAHALETYVTKKRNLVSTLFSREAWRVLVESFPLVLAEPTDLNARSGMQLGACLAGLAIEHSMLGATHALANPLTAHYGIAHGQAIGLMLPHVLRFNAEECDGWYRELVKSTPGMNGKARSSSGGEALAEIVRRLVEQAGLPTQLSQCGVEQERLPELAGSAAKQWTGGFNPRTVGEEELLKLYREAY